MKFTTYTYGRADQQNWPITVLRLRRILSQNRALHYIALDSRTS